jgi:hypothetical protein
MRGLLDAEIAAQRGVGDADRVRQEGGVERAGHVLQRDVDRGGHDAQVGAGEHHHHAVDARQMGEILGMAGKGEARPVDQRLLVDGSGGQRRRLAAHHQVHGAGDDGDDGLGIGRVGPAGTAGAGKGWDRTGRPESATWAASAGWRWCGPARPDGRDGRVADHEEGQPRAEPLPRRHREFGADPGRLTDGQGDGREGGQRTLTRRRRR